jgi:hypothetical protein
MGGNLSNISEAGQSLNKNWILKDWNGNLAKIGFIHIWLTTFGRAYYYNKVFPFFLKTFKKV